MPASTPPPAAPPPPAWRTLTVATCNTMNLAAPGRVFYANQEPYGAELYARKVRWLGEQFARLNADVLALQEVWDASALRDAAAASDLRYPALVAPGAEDGAVGTPRVALATRLTVDAVDSVADFAPSCAVAVPELGLHTRFERPVLHARLRTRDGQRLHVMVVHLKSKRPKLLQDADGRAREDADDPAVLARGLLRSLLMRAAEAAALRALVVSVLAGTREPLVLLGDLNDAPHSVTSQIVAAVQDTAFDRAARDTALHHAWDVATEPALRRDLAYSHVHRGWPELLDQVWVSEEFVAASRRALGDVRRVDVFNDHLHESRERWRSDHGFVRALLRWRIEAAAGGSA